MTIDCDKTLSSSLQSVLCREFDEDGGLISSKVLLTAPFSELRGDSESSLHSVQLVLTTDCEIVVLKKSTDKVHRYSFLRRHKLDLTEFKMHNLLANAFTATIPHTILKYTYQLYGTPNCTIGEWLLKIARCKMSKGKSAKEKNSISPKRAELSTAGQSTNYQPTDETLSTNAYSSPTHPIQRQLPPHSSLHPYTSVSEGALSLHPHTSTGSQVQHPLMNGHSKQTVVQMPNGLIKARSFQGRGSVKKRFVRTTSSSSDLDKRSTPEDLDPESTSHLPLPDSQPRTPSPIADDVNPFESRLRHTQVRNKKRVISPRINRSGSCQSPAIPHVEELREGKVYSRSANSTPLPGVSSSLVIASLSAAASDMAGPSFTRGYSGTLPRTKKGKKERFVSVSDTASGTSLSKTPGKSPKILRMFHRRWQSSSSIKVPPLDTDDQPSPSTEYPSNKKLYQFNPKEVAEELSLMDAELLRKIAPEELENGVWMKKDQKDKLAPNIMAMVRSFNQLALLIPSEILEEKTPQGRAKIITAYIQVAAKLYSNHNYNSLKAVLAGLQSTPIFRLKKTWKEVPSKKRKRFEQLCALMSECENWQLYRSEIDRRLSSGSSFIPFLGQFLTQIIQTDSYNQAREDRKAISLSPSETPTKSLLVPLIRQRTRSSSLGDSAIHSTSSPTTTDPNSEEPSTSSLTIEDITISVSAPVSPVHQSFKTQKKGSTSSQSTDSDKEQHTHSKSPSFDSNCPSPPLSVIASDEDEIDGHDDNTTDSGHHSSSGGIDFRRTPSVPRSSSHSTLCVGGSPSDRQEESGSELELSQIYVSLQRHSQSYETLLNTYTKEDPGLRHVLHTTLSELKRLSTSLQSLDSDVDVFSDDEEEDTFTSSLNVTCPPDFDSDADRTSDYGSDVNTLHSESPKTVGGRRPRRILFRAKSVNVDESVCSLSPECDQCVVHPEEVSETTIDPEDSHSKKSKRLQRSKSCSAEGKLTKRRRYKKKSRKMDEDKKTDYEQPKTPSEMLNRFQVASIRCTMGVKENGELRSAIRSVEPNSESASYKLSVEREGREVNG